MSENPTPAAAPVAAPTPTSPCVVVLAGGLSHERDVSIRSGRRVAEALRSTGVDVTVHDVDADLLPLLGQRRPDVVWPLLHGNAGEDGSVTDVLELLDLPYVGSGPRQSRLAWDKTIAKGIIARLGITTPESVALPQALFRELGAKAVLRAVVEKVGLPLVVKPSQGGSALGVTIVTEPSQLPQAMVYCFAYGQVALIEKFVRGRELAVSVIDDGDGPRALPPVEIVADGPYDYDARYNPGRVEYYSPARLDASELAAVAETALEVHRGLGLRHLSRTDVIVEDDGTIQFLEVSSAPGVTETSLLPQAAVADGLDLSKLYRSLVEAALA